MPQSLTQIYLHIIFSTKNRQPFLDNEQIRKQTHAYLAGICKNLQCPSLLVGGVADHVHLLTRHSKNVAVADFIGNLKRDSSKWVKGKDRELTSFYWQIRIRSFFYQPFSCWECQRIHRYPGRTPSPWVISGWISPTMQEIWCWVGWALRLGLSREKCKTPSGFCIFLRWVPGSP